MKKLLLLPLFGLLAIGFTSAQEAQINNGFGLGFQLNQYQKDFGFGIQLTSPYFLHDRMAVRVRGNFMFHEHISVESQEYTWTPYSNITLGLVGVGGYVGEHIRLYGEGGAMLLLPSDDFSSESSEIGFYGTFGFEFYSAPHINYFIEIGGVGTGAKADKIPLSPIYSNGLMLSVGFRHVFK